MRLKFRYVYRNLKQNYWLINWFSCSARHLTPLLSLPWSIFPSPVTLSPLLLSLSHPPAVAVADLPHAETGLWRVSYEDGTWACVCMCVFPHYNCVGQSHPSSHSAGIHLLMGGECWGDCWKEEKQVTSSHKRTEYWETNRERARKQKSQAAERKHDR